MAPGVQIPTAMRWSILTGSPDTPTYLGSYRVLDVLGEGGSACVYLGEHTLLSKKVAIKTLLPALAELPGLRARFLEEARIACSLEHPNLIRVLDFGFAIGSGPFCVMELAAGETLAARIARGPLPLSESLEIAIRITEAVVAMHSAGIVHRDIKSENVVLTVEGGNSIPKLIDFGIAVRCPSGSWARDVELVGTPCTMAPEQIASDPVDQRTDVWALGILLFEMITGALPFPATGRARDDFMAVLTQPPPPIERGVPQNLRDIVAACLSKEPEERPSSAQLRDRLLLAREDYEMRQQLIDRALVESDVVAVLAELEAELAADERTVQRPAA
jgi:serine/threonine protein kinase